MPPTISRDLLGGVTLIVIGALGWALLGDLPVGTAFRIGPAFLPTGVSWLVIGLGTVIALRALARRGDSPDPVAIRPALCVLLAFVAFSLLIERVGMIAAGFALVTISALGEKGGNIRHAIALGAVLTAIAVLVFRILLGLPLQVLPQWT
jgi:hypothetical protein